ncbi:response regulator [Salinimicrobium flavum]|uniref:Response regulator n=1 Tax=Salinimicrobium flavum TaxID=1737065 RepID=A0ABW5IY10_9FLAO
MKADIVIVDDDAVVLLLHKILVQKSSLTSNPICYDNAVDTLSFVLNRNPAIPLLILLDINMPQMSGWDLLDELKQLPPFENVFVVMVTSSINGSDRDRAIQYEKVIDYREKPLTDQACEEIFLKLLRLVKS